MILILKFILFPYPFFLTIPAEADKRPSKKVVTRAGTNITLPCIGLAGEKSVSKIEKLTWKSSQTIIKYISGRPLEQIKGVSVCSSVKMDFSPEKLSTPAKKSFGFDFSRKILPELFIYSSISLFSPLRFYYFFQRSLNPKNFSLHFNPVNLTDSGEYVCIVNDKPATGSINLVVQDVPQAPERPMITGFGSRWVNLSWTHNGDPRNAPVTHFIIELR